MTRASLLVAAGLVFACGSSPVSSEPSHLDASAPDSAPPLEPLDAWLSISDVAVFQGPKAPIFVGGAPLVSTPTPIIAARPGMVRVYLKMLEKRTKPHHLSADLHVSSGGNEIAVAHDEGFISVDSTDDQVDSGFKFALDANAFTTASTLTLVVTDLTLPPNAPGTTLTFPADGSSVSLHADATVPDIKITFVPVEYDADKSGRLPDTSVLQIQRFHDTLFRMYPAATITTTVAPVLPFNTVIDPMGAGWDELVQALIDRRATDNPSDDVYYVALFATTASFNTFCSQGCIGGVGLTQGATDPTARVAVVADYNVQFARDTLNQELAHSMGREHAPCGGPSGIDPKFPYLDGSAGVWGYDIVNSNWVDPAMVSDFMSYCHPIGVSDYTYAALYKQMKYVRKTKTQSVISQRARVIRLLADGRVKDGGVIHVQPAPLGAIKRVDFVDHTGRLVVSSDRFFSYDQLGGGIALVPEETSVSGIAHGRVTN